MPTIVGILTFMSRIKFMLSCVEHEKSIITSGPGHLLNFDTVMSDVEWRPWFCHLNLQYMLEHMSRVMRKHDFCL